MFPSFHHSPSAPGPPIAQRADPPTYRPNDHHRGRPPRSFRVIDDRRARDDLTSEDSDDCPRTPESRASGSNQFPSTTLTSDNALPDASLAEPIEHPGGGATTDGSRDLTSAPHPSNESPVSSRAGGDLSVRKFSIFAPINARAYTRLTSSTSFVMCLARSKKAIAIILQKRTISATMSTKPERHHAKPEQPASTPMPSTVSSATLWQNAMEASAKWSTKQDYVATSKLCIRHR
ncbi:hypothetical protein SISNIDRAFT_459165 [Sistotremastrum niveocremeum HHB9708]|uniref:Uncharacterized protein n=1 Tax=Sistotremastrum niveocremeum HHB9708 TaxID=1314777 RepID=A0A164PYT2_9AGAM|nr:hypothetical protein SISNIDRAFT_459165 [Sistotremastrum niveocremeum HHB9708]